MMHSSVSRPAIEDRNSLMQCTITTLRAILLTTLNTINVYINGGVVCINYCSILAVQWSIHLPHYIIANAMMELILTKV